MTKETIKDATVNPINFFDLQRVTDPQKITQWISVLRRRQALIATTHYGKLTGDIANLFSYLTRCYKDLLAGREENLIPDLTIPNHFEQYSEELVELFKANGILLVFHYAEPGKEFRSIGGSLRSSWKATAKLILKDAE